MMPQDSDGDRLGIIVVAADPAHAYADVNPVFNIFDATTGQATATLSVPVVNEIVPRPDGTRVFVINNAGDVRVVDPATGTQVASVNLGAPLGRATLNAAGTRLYIRSFAVSAVFVVDTAGPSLVATVPVGSLPLEPVLTGDGQKVLVVNQGSNTVSLIDTTTNAVTATLSPGGSLFDLATNPAAARAYVADLSGNRVIVIDTASDTVLGDIPLLASPNGLTVSADGARLFVSQGASGIVSVVDTQTNAIVDTLAVNDTVGKAVIGPGGRVFIPVGRSLAVIQ
jgi:YVTN family beta-propeller protein